MFARPIKYSPLNSLEELIDFSIQLPCNHEERLRKIWNVNSGWVIFYNSSYSHFLTPWRPEIPKILKEHDIFENNKLFVPPVSEYDKTRANWLWKIASEECWAYAHQEAKKIADEKGIKEVEIAESVKVREITFDYNGYRPMVMKSLSNDSRLNIGTYILVDDKTVYVCDEYGRSYVVEVKKVINDVINMLIDAGYTRNIHPWLYIQEDQRQEDPKRKLIFEGKIVRDDSNP